MLTAHWWTGNFGRLWAATIVSRFGALLGAISLTAIVYLDATPAQMGVLVAATTAPAVAVAMLAGVWVDRLPRRSLMLFADFGRWLLLLSIPLAALLDSLTMPQLYVVAFLEGCLEVVFNLAYRSVLPAMVAHEQLVDANARLRAGEAVAESVGPTAGGAVVQAAGAPAAVLVNALTFFASGLFLLGIRLPPREPQEPSRPALQEAREGLATVVREARLRAILGLSATYGFFGSFLITLFALRVLRDLDFSPVALGLLAVGGGVGSFAGAGLVGPMTRRLGLGPSIIVAYYWRCSPTSRYRWRAARPGWHSPCCSAASSPATCSTSSRTSPP